MLAAVSTHLPDGDPLGTWLVTHSHLEPLLDPAARLAAKGDRRISVVLPTLDEAPTIGGIVEAILADPHTSHLVDQVLVVDSGSTDGTVEIARSAGAEVVDHRTLVPEAGVRVGKGEGMWKALAAAVGDVVVYLDGDLETFDPSWVDRLVEPLLVDDDLRLVKGSFDRPLGPEQNRDGGRVTQLVARPLLSSFFPELLGLRQPLSGEIAARRDALVELPFAPAFGVDIGLVIDTYQRWGLDALAQVELGERRHAHQSTADLARMAVTIMHTVFRRAGVTDVAGERFLQVVRDPDALHLEVHEIPSIEREPFATYET
jgi:glucosyl-3-phosphoglycerate synthase